MNEQSEHKTIADALGKTRRVALYARCSTRDQHPENQTIELHRYAQARNWTVVEEFVDVGVSGARDRRPQLDRLMDAARKRKVDVVLVSRFDRFARSVRHLVAALDEFRNLGVAFVSYNENLDTTTPTGQVMFHIVAAMSQFERTLIVDRVHAGLRRARAQGKRLGRPPVTIDAERVRLLRDQGLSLRQIAREMSISKDAVARALSQKGS